MVERPVAIAVEGEARATGGGRASRREERRRLLLRRFLRNRTAVAGVVVLVVLVALALVGPPLSPWSIDDIDRGAFLKPPGGDHPLGTTQAGRDMLALTLHGLQRSLLIGFAVALLSTAVAAIVGAFAAWYGGWPERVSLWVIDLLLVIPAFLLIALVTGGGVQGSSSTWLLVALLAVFGWMLPARVVRSLTHGVREREFVLAARFMGQSGPRIVFRHILPNISSLLIIDATLNVSGAILAETSLAWFGFGVQPPDTSLGTLLGDGARQLNSFPWLFAGPAATIVLLILSVNAIGDGLRDALDPGSGASGTARPPKRKARAGDPATGAATTIGGPSADAPASDRSGLAERVERVERVERASLTDSTDTVASRRADDARTNDADVVLAVDDLHVSFPGEDGPVHAVRGLDLTLRAGESLAIVRESGSGKSATALAIMGLHPPTAAMTGSIRLRGQELVGRGDAAMSRLRGESVAMIFQDPLSALTPVYSIGHQIVEAIRVHRDTDTRAATARAVELLDLVGIPDPRRRVHAFPHELSGGMRQRAMIAMAIANEPDILIADEPTTALDATVQAQILTVLETARRESGAALLVVTHDLGVVAGIADRVAVMYAGRTVERGDADAIFHRPRMPYTIGLLGSVPRPDDRRTRRLACMEGYPPSATHEAPGCPFAPRCPMVEDTCHTREPVLATTDTAGHLAACLRSAEIAALAPATADLFGAAAHLEDKPDTPVDERRRTVLELEGVKRHYPLHEGTLFRRRVGMVRAVDGVDLELLEGETLALVGESGSGKSTLLREILNLSPPDEGRISVLGADVAGLRGRAARKALRRDLQVVFQDPTGSLDPRMSVFDLIAEPLEVFDVPSVEHTARVDALLGLVGLEPGHAARFPQQLSGGQRQRVGIARALALEPRVLLLDEPVSALDVSVRAGVINLLQELKSTLDLSYLFVAHDLALVRHVADRVAVMNRGRIVETGDVERVYENPAHPVTRALLAAIPVPDPDVERQRYRVRQDTRTTDDA